MQADAVGSPSHRRFRENTVNLPPTGGQGFVPRPPFSYGASLILVHVALSQDIGEREIRESMELLFRCQREPLFCASISWTATINPI